MEVNGRFNLSSLLMLRSGINLPAMAYRYEVLGEAPASIEQPEGMHWIDGTKDLVYGWLPELVRHPAGLPAFVRPYRQPHVFAVLAQRRCSSVRRALSGLARRGYLRVARKVRMRLLRPRRSTYPG